MTGPPMTTHEVELHRIRRDSIMRIHMRGKPRWNVLKLLGATTMPANHDAVGQQYCDAFTSILGIEGRTFGRGKGVSDGESIQWSLAVGKESTGPRLSVNLEGSEKTGKWLIAKFLRSRPPIAELKAGIIDRDQVGIAVSIVRDAWRYSVREKILESHLGSSPVALSELNQVSWDKMLDEALACLDEAKDYRGRKKQQPVTLKSTGEVVKRNVSPHLNIGTMIARAGDIENNMRNAFRKLCPVYEWVHKACGVSEMPHYAVCR